MVNALTISLIICPCIIIENIFYILVNIIRMSKTILPVRQSISYYPFHVFLHPEHLNSIPSSFIIVKSKLQEYIMHRYWWPLSMYCQYENASSSRCCGLVSSVLVWHFLVILTYLMTHSYEIKLTRVQPSITSKSIWVQI